MKKYFSSILALFIASAALGYQKENSKFATTFYFRGSTAVDYYYASGWEVLTTEYCEGYGPYVCAIVHPTIDTPESLADALGSEVGTISQRLTIIGAFIIATRTTLAP
ncbi:hypothetical protein MKQ70_32040 [Chitinophaga sedimenti]|uniref:hypothetical protein n=1 Tax=Chitinophaga sedimenti TaxID=2033606 RepID=UPI002004E950|nr:hypothetical protein [Chitinophaga sedimenti]MCK7559349.1 hypothetical protein [Chitinophaga sedimenti]